MKVFMRLILIVVLGIWIVPANAQWVQLNLPTCSASVWSFAQSGSMLYAGGMLDTIFVSTDNGTTWSALAMGCSIDYIWSLAFHGTDLFAGTDKGVFVSKDLGKIWNKIGTDLENQRVYCLGFHESSVFAGTCDSGVYVLRSGDTKWVPSNSGLAQKFISSIIVKGHNIFAGTLGDGIYCSSDDGVSWYHVGLTQVCVTQLVLEGSSIYVGSQGGLYKNDGNDTQWTALTKGSVFSKRLFRSLIVAGSKMFSGTDFGDIIYSTDDGSNWSSTIAMPGSNCIALTISEGYLYASLEFYGVWRRPLSEMITGVRDGQVAIPFGISLYFNHPNPFFTSTTISFTTPSRSFVSLKIFDALGRKSRRLCPEISIPDSTRTNGTPLA